MRATVNSASLVLISNADERYKRARTFLQETVRAALPIGTRVEVELGRAFVRGLISRHGQAYHDPADIWLVNEKTGKERRFDATFDRFRILEMSKKMARGAERHG